MTTNDLEESFATMCDEFVALLKAGKIDAARQRHEQCQMIFRELKRRKCGVGG